VDPGLNSLPQADSSAASGTIETWLGAGSGSMWRGARLSNAMAAVIAPSAARTNITQNAAWNAFAAASPRRWVGRARDLAGSRNEDGPRPGHLRSDFDRFVEVLAVDQAVAADLLLGLRERTVGDQDLAVANQNCCSAIIISLSSVKFGPRPLVVQAPHAQVDDRSSHPARLIGSHEDRHVRHLRERRKPSRVGPACA
jgi:hypothetical protein